MQTPKQNSGEQALSYRGGNDAGRVMRTHEPVVQIHGPRARVLLALLERALERLRKTGHSPQRASPCWPLGTRTCKHLSLHARVDALASIGLVVVVRLEHLEELGVLAEQIADGVGCLVVQHLCELAHSAALRSRGGHRLANDDLGIHALDLHEGWARGRELPSEEARAGVPPMHSPVCSA